MKKTSLLLLLLLLATVISIAQSRKVNGHVTDDNGKPIDGASVMVKGATGAQTDKDGNFSITVNSAGKITIEVSHKSFKTETVTTDGTSAVSFKLTKEVAALDDVVIIGYGTARKKDLTGAVGTVSGKELQKTPVANAAEALIGKIAGVQVTATEGSPDAEIKVRLRGGGSISQDNSPLYIVDGFPVSNINNIAASDIQTITFLKDAASTAIYGSRAANGVFLVTTKEGKSGKISVTANAYAGVRKVTKELNVLSPYEYVQYQYEIDQSAIFQNYYGAYSDLDIYKSQKGTDWQKEVFGRSAKQQYYNVGVSGGSKTTRFNLGLTRNKEESVMIGSGYERNNLNFKLNSDINEKLSFDFNTRLSYMIIDGAGVNTGSGATTKLRNSVKYAPTRGLRAFDPSIGDDNDINSPETASLLYDPVQSSNDEYKKQYRLQSNFNAGLTWKIIKNLSFRSEAGYEFRNERTDNVWGPATANSKNYAGQPIGNIYTLAGNSWRLSNYLTYDKTFLRGHQLNIVAGQEALSTGYKTITDEARFFPLGMKATDVLANMNFGKPIPTLTYQAMDDAMNSYFGRANYSYKGRYFATATLRADGSSKFAPGRQWGYFPAASLAWRISEERFLEAQQSWLDQLKLRVSYGATGNNRIPNNAWQSTYNTSNENKPYYYGEAEASNFIPNGILYNPLLTWETTINRNTGLDFSVFKGRLSGTVDVYWNTTKDLLLLQPLPANSGYTSQYQNIGQTSNRGVEITLDAMLISKKDFSLSASFNIGFNRNNVDKFSSGTSNFKTYSTGWNGTAQPLDDYIVQEGKPVGQMYGYVTEGMYSFDDFTYNAGTQKWDINKGVADNSGVTSAGTWFGPGALKFKDLPTVDNDGDGKPDAGDGIIDSKDKQIIGNANPKNFGGLNLTARYKAFDLGVFLNWTYGNDIYNANKLDYSAFLLSRKYQNIISDMDLSHRFTTIDPATGLNIYSGKNANPQRLKELNQNASIWMPMMTQTPLHSWAVEDGSFLRINNISLGYSIPARVTKKMHMQGIRLYATVYNLYTLTNYSGYDPEVDTRRNPPLTPGVDYSAYPKSRSFVGGINVTF